jgi:hypothetical protein
MVEMLVKKSEMTLRVNLLQVERSLPTQSSVAGLVSFENTPR